MRGERVPVLDLEKSLMYRRTDKMTMIARILSKAAFSK